jgi:hypothetical protein
MDYQKNYERLKKSLIKSIKEMITPFVDSFGGELVLTDSPYTDIGDGQISYLLKIMTDGILTTDYIKIKYEDLNVEALLELHSFIKNGIIYDNKTTADKGN